MKLYTNNMLQQQMSKASGQITPNIPAKVYLDLTPDCNLYCIMCRESIENSNRMMDLKLFKRIIDETCEGVTGYSLFYTGESLLLHDFKDRLEYISKRKSPGTLLDISTNGMLLTEDISRFLIDQDIEVCISFDGSNAELFERIRRGSSFTQICRNVERIAALASHMNPFRAPGIGISIQKYNWRDLTNIIKTANNLGVRRISMWPVVNPDQCKIETTEKVMRNIADAIHYAEEKGMAVDMYPVRLKNYIWNSSEYTDIADSFVDTKCHAPFTCTAIAWDGEVNLCCNYGDTVENMSNKSFKDVWTSERYRELRRQVNDEASMPESCQNCFWVNRF
ncbi:MAG TPA: radical SAM protein [Dehalococcoidia bacterium]|nr:radical SAM protein [Dehalococcoidia bacterium]